MSKRDLAEESETNISEAQLKLAHAMRLLNAIGDKDLSDRIFGVLGNIVGIRIDIEKKLEK